VEIFAGNFTGYIEENHQKFRIAVVLAEISPEHNLEEQLFQPACEIH
jgi:hypothetical protein